jgi:hypothetical protein
MKIITVYIRKKGILIDTINQSFNSLESLKIFLRSKYSGNIEVETENKNNFNLTCDSENFLKREFIYK